MKKRTYTGNSLYEDIVECKNVFLSKKWTVKNIKIARVLRQVMNVSGVTLLLLPLGLSRISLYSRVCLTR